MTAATAVLAVPSVDVATSLQRAYAAWQVADQQFVRHQRTCRRYGTSDAIYCAGCSRLESATLVAAGAVARARREGHR
jgi:hypothetical protein